MKEKKVNSSTILIIIVSILLILTIGYIVYETTKSTKLNESDNNSQSVDVETDTKEEKVEEISIDDEFVKKTHDKSQYTVGCGNILYILDYNLKIGDVLLANLLTDKDKLNLAISNLGVEVLPAGNEYYTSDEITNSLKSVLGDNYTFNKNNLIDYDLYSYDSSKDRFYKDNSPFGCTAEGPFVEKEIFKAEKKSSDMSVYQVISFGESVINHEKEYIQRKLYKDENRNQLLDDNFEETESLSKYAEQLPQYKYTFKKDATTGNYYFYSIERVN